MAIYRTCPRCGANLDPGERCDCELEEEEARERLLQALVVDPRTGQLTFLVDGVDGGGGYATSGTH